MPNPNTMTILELDGRILADLLDDLRDSRGVRTLRLAVEVEPDGTIYYKHKVNEGGWTPPYDASEGLTARAEVLYDA